MARRKCQFFEDYYRQVVAKAPAAAGILVGLRARMEIKGGSIVPRGSASYADLRTIVLGFVQVWMAQAMEMAPETRRDDRAGAAALAAHGKFIREWFWGIWKLRQAHCK